MDSGVGKTGRVYLQPRKPGKKWKPVWLTLVPPSSSGVGRLEIQDRGGTLEGPGRRRHQALGDRKPKIIRLSELLNVLKLPPNAEACPMENMCAFCVETQERTLVFADLKDDCADWVDKLCLNTFQFQKTSVPELKPQMEENVIYASADDVSDFRVTVQRTDAAVRCGLQGAYWLHVGRESLLLKDAQKIKVQEWNYELLRRYGKDKGSLFIETGRRCDCGPGTIIFETPQAENIFSLIQSTIKRKTTHTAPSAGHSPVLPRTPELSSLSSIFENKLKMDNEEVITSSPHPAPITFMPLPSLPKQEVRSQTVLDNVYADPQECMKSPEVSVGLYVDPASILPLKPPLNAEPSQDKLHSVYSEVFDKVSVKSQSAEKSNDPIYSEPEKVVEEKEVKRADPFAHLYAQVCKTNKRAASPQPTKEETGKNEADAIYENLGII